MIDYTVFYKRELPPIADAWPDDLHWNVFISAYTSSQRAYEVFNKVDANIKHWLLFPEYNYTKDEYPIEESFPLVGYSESEILLEYLETHRSDISTGRLCVDTTGFIRPYLMFLVKWLADNNIRKFDALYSEPSHYEKKEKTRFSDEVVTQVRQVQGFEGIHVTNTQNDLLIIGSGYDHEPIAQVAESKNNAKKVQILGLPSLRPDMYQENVLRAHLASESVGIGMDDEAHSFFAPAYDPFVTASILRNVVNRYDSGDGITNLYLCPLATKAQVLGFTMYYLTERIGTPTSIIYPFTLAYSKQTSKGISRVWHYIVELPVGGSTPYSRFGIPDIKHFKESKT